MAPRATPKAPASASSPRECPASRGRQISASSTAAKATRRNAVAAGPRSSNSVFAMAAPHWVDAMPTTTKAGAGTARTRFSRGGLLAGGQHGDHAPAPAVLELDGAGPRGEDRVVLADAHALARLEAGAALAHDDLAATHDLAGEHLHAEPLRVRVAAVAAGAESLLVRHYFASTFVISRRVSSERWPAVRL